MSRWAPLTDHTLSERKETQAHSAEQRDLPYDWPAPVQTSRSWKSEGGTLPSERSPKRPNNNMQHVTLGYTLGYAVFWFGVFGAIKDIPEPPAKREHGLW